MSTLDIAYIELINQTNETLHFYRQFTNCFECPLIKLISIYSNQNLTVKLETFFQQKFVITNQDGKYWYQSNNNNDSCNLCDENCEPKIVNLNDQSRSILRIDSDQNCTLKLVDHGQNDICHLTLVLLVYLLFMTVFYIKQVVLKRYWRRQRENNSFIQQSFASDESLDRSNINRFSSIDAFRGITILLMIFVNYGAGQYKFLQHSPWDGIHLADIVFPFFIFIMGLSIAVSFYNHNGRSNISVMQIFYTKILRRSICLFILGIIVNSIGAADLSTIRVPGVLQRFAISYGIVATVHLFSRNIINICYLPVFIRQISQYFPLWMEYSLASIMLYIYTYFTFYWKYNDHCPVGYVGPGGLYQNMSHPYCVGGAAHQIDRMVFGANHCYKHYTPGLIYNQNQFIGLWHDPEGVLGCTTSVILTLIGLQVGCTLVYNPQAFARIRRWIIFSLFLALFTLFTLYGVSIPINKNLWSISFVTLNGFLATLIFALFHYLIDLKHLWPNGWPFHYAGQNSIFLYMGHEIARDMFPFRFVLSTVSSFQHSHIGYLAQNLLATTIWFWISIYLATKQIFISV